MSLLCACPPTGFTSSRRWVSPLSSCPESLVRRLPGYRDSSAQLWISKSHLCPDERELQYFCLCDRESPNIWSTCSPSSTCPLPALDSCRHRTGTAFSVTNAFESPWTDLLNAPDDVNFFIRNMNCNPDEQTVILYNDNILTKLFSDAFTCRDSRSFGITEQCMNNNIEGLFKCIGSDNVNISNKDHHAQGQRNVINKAQTGSCLWDDRRTWKAKERRKSVSFADDVIVYLYDKDSPTEKSQHEFSSRPAPEILFDDNDLEWEDDFLALEKKCQSHTDPKTHRSTFSLSAQNWTVNKPKSLVLSQSCLFLTHVNESDLELWDKPFRGW